jgi:hypothetical protein
VEGGTALLPAHDWILDLLVLWRWPGEAPEIADSGGGEKAARVDGTVVP